MADGIMTQAEESRLRDRLELDSSGTDRLMLDAKLAAIAFGGTFTGASTQLYKTGNYRLATAKGSHYNSSDLSPNPPKDTDGRREDSGRGWVRELQGRWPGVLG